MSHTTQKHRNFVSEPIGKKPCTDIAGIDDEIGKRLTEGGFGKASTLLGQYLMFKKDYDQFKGWMQNMCGANSKQATDCYQCLSDWCKEYM